MKPFFNVESAKVLRSPFNLSYQKIMSADMQYIYPIQVDSVLPGDIWRHGIQCVVRCMPLVAPILHEINVTIHSYFWPYRFLVNGDEGESDFDWEKYITGGKDGNDAQTLPTWTPSGAPARALGSLWDYLGFPPTIDPQGFYPMDGPRQAYNMIYNEYYRDETICPEVYWDNETLLKASWIKDYFSSAAISLQRGTAPTLPIGGTTFADFSTSTGITASSGVPTQGDLHASDTASNPYINTDNATRQANVRAALSDNVVDLSSATAIPVNDMRELFQIQIWMERNMRAGVRYNEYIKAHFRQDIGDARIDRPEYIGGMKFPITISDIPQTSESGTTEQGNLAGKGTAIESNMIGTYRVKEFGLIMTLMIIRPKAVYEQGINRQWIRNDRLEFYSPEFANLGEQAIYQGELYATAVSANNNTVFGYQGRYDEHRTKPNIVCGLMHGSWAGGTLDYWHISRQFGSAPTLNQTFLEAEPRKDFLAVPSEPAFVISVQNLIHAIRPLPSINIPGRIDH